MIFFFVSHIKDTKNAITDSQEELINSTAGYSAYVENN